jgi:hypothetical protein
MARISLSVGSIGGVGAIVCWLWMTLVELFVAAAAGLS